MTVAPGSVLLGTVALEPNRWATVVPGGSPTIELSTWVPAAASAGFDGLEVWDRHLSAADAPEATAVLAGALPLVVFNSYASFDDLDEVASGRAAAVDWVARARSRAVKFNVGNDLASADAYAERAVAWLDAMPPDVVLLCECHAGISIAEDPVVAAKVLAAIGPADRVQAIVHTHESADHVRARFDAYGDRITHVHLNFLDPTTYQAPPLAQAADRLAAAVDVLRTCGFAGSWTIEFVAGVLTDRDRPDLLVEQAAADLEVLRAILADAA